MKKIQRSDLRIRYVSRDATRCFPPWQMRAIYYRVYQPCIHIHCTYFPAAAAEHCCCAAAAASRRRELRLMTDVAESCAPFPLQLQHAHLQLHLLPLPLSLTDTDSTTVLDAHVFSPLHEFGASCPLPKIVTGKSRMLRCVSSFINFSQRGKTGQQFLYSIFKTVQKYMINISLW